MFAEHLRLLLAQRLHSVLAVAFVLIVDGLYDGVDVLTDVLWVGVLELVHGSLLHKFVVELAHEQRHKSIEILVTALVQLSAEHANSLVAITIITIIQKLCNVIGIRLSVLSCHHPEEFTRSATHTLVILTQVCHNCLRETNPFLVTVDFAVELTQHVTLIFVG